MAGEGTPPQPQQKPKTGVGNEERQPTGAFPEVDMGPTEPLRHIQGPL